MRVQQIHIRYNKYTKDDNYTRKTNTVNKNEKTKKVLYIVSNIFPTILHTRFYLSPSLLTTLPPIYILPITPRFQHNTGAAVVPILHVKRAYQMFCRIEVRPSELTLQNLHEAADSLVTMCNGW